jgi:hypothetical protein
MAIDVLLKDSGVSQMRLCDLIWLITGHSSVLNDPTKKALHVQGYL